MPAANINVLTLCVAMITAILIKANPNKYKYPMNRQPWTQEQDNAIIQLIDQYGLNDWTQIAITLKHHYTFSKRTGKQCRQRWYNHLSPAVSKLPWTSLEQQSLFQMHQRLGNRWKDISKAFPGRTDNDIKNHFYSTLRRSLRRLNKILGQRNSTTQMREIKPSVLTTIMHQPNTSDPLQPQTTYLKDLASLIFQFAHFKPVKKSPVPPNLEEIKDKITEIFQIISQFNEQYETLKLGRHCRKNIKKAAPLMKKAQSEEVPEMLKEEPTPKTQISIKQQVDQSIDYYVYNLDIPRDDDQSEIHLHRNVSHMSLDAHQEEVQFGDPEQPSKLSQAEHMEMMELNEQCWAESNQAGHEGQELWWGGC